MKDSHLIDALKRALERSAERPSHALDLDREARRRRSAGWVTIAEIEANQSPNTYPRFGKRAIRERCEAWNREPGPPYVRVDRGAAGLRTWVRLEAAPVEVVPVVAPDDGDAFSAVEGVPPGEDVLPAEVEEQVPPPATR